MYEPSLRMGETLGHYEIVELLGRGGMGEVYKARDLRLGRWVAVKILPTSPSLDSTRRRRFHREARAASALNHSGIVTIYEIFETEDRDVMVMEWVQGQTLRELLDAGRIGADAALRLLKGIAKALAVAHEAGVVHRDLKPSNIMIGEEGIKILDFGIAKMVPVSLQSTMHSDSLDTLTEQGAVPGTAPYMSPEQALGETIDARSDIFSFGIVAYEMLAGRRPFRGETLATLTRQILFAEPEPLATTRQDIPQALAEVAYRALAKKPEDRFPDMASLLRSLEDLDTASGESPSLARPTSELSSGVFTSSEAARPAVSNRTWQALLVASLASLVVGGFYVDRAGLFSDLVKPQGLFKAESGDAPAKGSIDAAASAYELYREGAQILERYDRDGAIDQAISLFTRAVEQAEDYAPAHSGLARAYWRQYRLKRDKIWLDRAQHSAQSAVRLAPQLSHAQVSAALVATSLGDQNLAQEIFSEQIRLNPANADSYRGLADLLVLEGQMEEAVEAYGQAIERRSGDWELHSQLGIAQLRKGDLEDAELAFKKSIELAPDSAYPRRNLAAVYHYQGRFADAATELQRSIEIRPTAAGYSNLGTLFFFEGLYRQAAEALEEARELGANDYVFWANLGDTYRQIPGRSAESMESFDRAIQLSRAELVKRPNDPELRSRLALYLAKNGRIEAALGEVSHFEALRESTPSTIYRVALVLELAGSRNLALARLEQALRSGYALSEVEREPELVSLREDLRYHRLVLNLGNS